MQSQRAWLQSKTPATALGEEWTIDVQLRIGGGGISLFGDGAALWLTKEPFQEGEVFARNPVWTGLGLFLDTYDNAPGKHVHKHPYVSAFMSGGDHKFSYSELEADDKSLEDPSHAASRAHAGCHARLRQYGRDPKIVTVRISYTRAVQKLVVRLFLGRRRDQYRSAADYAWQQCFALHSVDIPPGYWLAASASTGQLTDTHEVLSIDSRASGEPPAQAVPPGDVAGDAQSVQPDAAPPSPPAPEAQTPKQEQQEPPAPPAPPADAPTLVPPPSSVQPPPSAGAAPAEVKRALEIANQGMDALRGDVSAFKREVRLALQQAQDSFAKHEDVTALQRSSAGGVDSLKAQMAGKASSGDVQRLQRQLQTTLQELRSRLDALDARVAASSQVDAPAPPAWLIGVALVALLGCGILGVMQMRIQHRMRKMHLP